MQFVKDGPDVPESLLQAHEEGRVIFFCGAGISYPAGLPNFRGLVDKIYTTLGATQDDLEAKAYGKDQFDAVLDLLERRIPGQRAVVRAALASVLTPNLRLKGARATHAALLQLARDRSGNVRLVTTNFDRIFEGLMRRAKPPIPGYSAPLLPIPKNSRWNGVVYLHGLLPDAPDANALNRLVISSGDFGLAYLTERWAARFAGELFRNYVVCFVGYSINDPVLRYMMDALAADRMLGENTPQAYAFGDFSPGSEDVTLVEWKAKGVTPVLYKVPPGSHNHSALHLTLSSWAATYRDGVIGKEGIISRDGVNPPTGSTREDNFVGRILWAISDASSLPAQRFAELDPVPPLAWLEPLSNDQFHHEDLSRFGVPPRMPRDASLQFSLARRPAPYTLAPWMTLVVSPTSGSSLDPVMFQLARWLVRHLDDPGLVLWIAKFGGRLHHSFARLIARRLAELDGLEAAGKDEEIQRILVNAPRAVPRPAMRSIWGLLLSGRAKSYSDRVDVFSWMERLKREGLTPTLRIELRELLAPRVSLSEPFRGVDEVDREGGKKRVSDLVRWEIVLATRYPRTLFEHQRDSAKWKLALPLLLDDFTTLLRDVSELKQELGSASKRSDLSYLEQPSISEHSQNNDFRDWTILIELNRDAWAATAKKGAERALRAADSWWATPYPLFKRLALFAATHRKVVPPAHALQWLLSDDGWWLWSEEIRREVMRWLVLISPHLGAADRRQLERAVRLGPPRKMFRKGIDEEQWSRLVDHGIWLRLAKMRSVSPRLSASANVELRSLVRKHPSFALASDERDEFPLWHESATWGGDSDTRPSEVKSPRRRRDLVEWVKANPHSDHWRGDDWRSRCSDNFATTACTLYTLALEGEWPAERWREALQAWSEEKLQRRSWRYMAPVATRAPDSLISEDIHGISGWLQAIAKSFEGHVGEFFALAHRVLATAESAVTTTGNPVTKAINHPVGHIVEALLRWWYRQIPEDSQGLPDSIKLTFTLMCDTTVDKYRHGRVILAANAIALFRVDMAWAMTYLLPLFDWRRSETEAAAAWDGFLWSPRLFRPLLAALKEALLDTALHYDQLEDHAKQYAEFLTFAALEPADTFTISELAKATAALPQDGLQHAAQALARALGGAGEQRVEYWRNRIRPYLLGIWPKSSALISPGISENLGRMCLAAADSFPDALGAVESWLVPVDHPHFLIHLLHEAKLSRRYPEASLDFMDRVIGASATWTPTELGECLREVVSGSPGLSTDPRFVRLATYHRANGGT